MAYIDSANIKGTLYELQDTQARTDVSDLKSAVTLVEESFPAEAFKDTRVPYNPDWVQGSCDNTGSFISSTTRIHTDYLPVGRGIVGEINSSGGVEFWVRMFDENKNFIGNADTDEGGNINSNTAASPWAHPVIIDSVQNDSVKYIVLTLKKTASYSTHITPSENNMVFTADGEPEFDGVNLDSIYQRRGNGEYSASELTLYYDVGNGYQTKGFLKLPPNYSADGKSVPLIVFIHGSGDVGYWAATSMTTLYQDYYNYLRDCGYALFDCWPLSYKYHDRAYSNTWGLPINNACYLSGIKYVRSKYNIDANNVMVACKSLGGNQALAMLQNPQMPVKAVGMLAPDLWCLSMLLGYKATDRQMIASELGFSEDTENVMDFAEGDSVPDGYYPYITANMDKWCGVFGNFKGLEISDENKPDYYTTWQARLTGEFPRSSLGRPLKIWIAEDDAAVSYSAAAALIKSLHNKGYYAQLRTMPNGTGGHHSVDSDANAPQTTNVTTRLGIFYASVPTAYYELEQFFHQFLTI